MNTTPTTPQHPAVDLPPTRTALVQAEFAFDSGKPVEVAAVVAIFLRRTTGLDPDRDQLEYQGDGIWYMPLPWAWVVELASDGYLELEDYSWQTGVRVTMTAEWPSGARVTTTAEWPSGAELDDEEEPPRCRREEEAGWCPIP